MNERGKVKGKCTSRRLCSLAPLRGNIHVKNGKFIYEVISLIALSGKVKKQWLLSLQALVLNAFAGNIRTLSMFE